VERVEGGREVECRGGETDTEIERDRGTHTHREKQTYVGW